MYKIVSLPRSAPIIAAIVLILTALGHFYDVKLWNEVCGARTRTYNAWEELSSTGALTLHMPFLLAGFLGLIAPTLLVRSHVARVTNTVLMSALLAGSIIFVLTRTFANYYECYSGGHENAPGDALLVMVFVGRLVSGCSFIVLFSDWAVWAVRLLHGSQQGHS